MTVHPDQTWAGIASAPTELLVMISDHTFPPHFCTLYKRPLSNKVYTCMASQSILVCHISNIMNTKISTGA